MPGQGRVPVPGRVPHFAERWPRSVSREPLVPRRWRALGTCFEAGHAPEYRGLGVCGQRGGIQETAGDFVIHTQLPQSVREQLA